MAAVTGANAEVLEAPIDRYGRRWGSTTNAKQIRVFHLDSLCSRARSPSTSTSRSRPGRRCVHGFAKGLHTAKQPDPDTIRDHFEPRIQVSVIALEDAERPSL